MHLGLLTVNGRFSSFSGKCVVNGDALQRIEGSIQVASINTDDETRDNSLRSNAYLDEKTYPFITFHSTTIDSGVEPSLIIGKLKLKDQERKIRMPVTYRISDDGTECLIIISTSISRSDFKLDLGPMDALVGDKVDVKLSLVAERDE